MAPLNLDVQTLRYRALIGTGGIGYGLFLALKGEHTLGREESRAVRMLDQRDYCKLHIITHYVQALLGPAFPTILIGRVGQDPVGSQLLDEMRQTGLDVRYVRSDPAGQTLFSVCFTYPDGTGGNLTSDDSACARVGAEDVRAAQGEFSLYAGRGIALAAPEVPLEARRELLELAGQHGFLRAGTFVSGELGEAAEMGLLGQLDLLALNVHEAASAAGLDAEAGPPEQVAEQAAQRLLGEHPALLLSITAGRHGSWTWDGARRQHVPAFPARVASSAGAGDAHLGGILAGLAAGLSLGEAQELGSLTAAQAVASPHTIAPGVDREALQGYAAKTGLALSPGVAQLLQEPDF